MEVLLQRIESVSQQQALSRLVFVGVAAAAAPSDALAGPVLGPSQPVDSLILTLPDADAAAYKVNQIYALSVLAKA